MKKVKTLCIGATIALGITFIPNFNSTNVQLPTATIQAKAATTYTVTSSGNLQKILKSAKKLPFQLELHLKEIKEKLIFLHHQKAKLE